MVIIRNGKEIELTWDEVSDAHKEFVTSWMSGVAISDFDVDIYTSRHFFYKFSDLVEFVNGHFANNFNKPIYILIYTRFTLVGILVDILLTASIHLTFSRFIVYISTAVDVFPTVLPFKTG